MSIIKPNYSKNFCNLPATILKLFNQNTDKDALDLSPYQDLTQDFDHVLLFFIDAFGWRFLKTYSENNQIPELVEMLKTGRAEVIHSQFPSSTAGHFTTITTGLPISESGVTEWFYYESRLDRVISPLFFSTPDSMRRNSLAELGVTPESYMPKSSFISKLTGAGIEAVYFNKQEYMFSNYNKYIQGEADTKTFNSHSEGLDKCREHFLQANIPCYGMYYFDEFDSEMHRHGVFSEAADLSISNFFENLYQQVILPLKSKKKKILYLFTADHGSTTLSPDQAFYVEDILPNLKDLQKTTRNGQLISPCGASRSCMLHIKPEHLETVYETLSNKLDSKAQVWKVDKLLEEGYFGINHNNPILKANLGDLIITPNSGSSVFHRGNNNQYVNNLKAAHGGLTRDEVESFVLFYQP